MSGIHILTLLLTGIAAGFSSGLLGVGGGFIMIPAQFWVLKTMGIDPTVAIRVALGTNLLVVLPTTLNGLIPHHRKGAVVWKAGISLGAASVCGAYLGAVIASHLPADIMTLIFGIFMLLVALRMLTVRLAETPRQAAGNLRLFILWGFLFGLFSGTLGIAGGGIYVPVMVFVLKFTMHQAVATSMVIMFFSAVGGSISFLVNGLGVSGLPPYSTGYVNWLQFALLAVCSIPMARVGATAAHRLKGNTIRYIFVVALIFIGLKMTGIFELWAG